MLTKREEIASRLLAGMMANPALFQVDKHGLVDDGNVMDEAVEYADDLIAKLAETEPKPDWVEWHGGERPVNGLVKYVLRNGSKGTADAIELYWDHGPDGNDPTEIIKYRALR